MTFERSTAEGWDIVDHPRRYDVLVAGGGNAALCAAIAARRAGASVLVLEARRQVLSRRQHAPYPQHALRPRQRDRDPDRPLYRGGVLGRSAARHRRQDRRGAGPPHDPRVEGDADLDRGAGRALPALARRHAEPRAHQLVLPRRRPRDAERALPHRRGARRRHPLRGRGRRARHRGRHVPVGRVQATATAGERTCARRAGRGVPAASRPTSTG